MLCREVEQEGEAHLIKRALSVLGGLGPGAGLEGAVGLQLVTGIHSDRGVVPEDENQSAGIIRTWVQTQGGEGYSHTGTHTHTNRERETDTHTQTHTHSTHTHTHKHAHTHTHTHIETDRHA